MHRASPLSPTATQTHAKSSGPIYHHFGAIHHHSRPLLEFYMATTTMPQPPDYTMACITNIIDLLHSRRTRIASLRLISLSPNFFDDLVATTDLPTFTQTGRLFQCLMEIQYTRGFSKPVDRAITKLLLHAIKGCDNQLSQLKSQHAHDRIYWLPSESAIKEILDIYRSFLQYITYQHSPVPLVKDLDLAEAKRRLSKLCPRINNINRISPSPTRPTAPVFWTDSPTTRQRPSPETPQEKVTKPRSQRATRNTKPAPIAQPRPHAVGLPTPPDTIPTPTSTTPICDRYLTIPTLQLTRNHDPNLKISIPRGSQRKYIARLRVVNGMVEEVTQPFTPNHEVDKLAESKELAEGRNYAEKADAQLKREYAEWREKCLRGFLRFSPEPSGERCS
ncbi:hypothetical protein QBC34DRAFT_465704 [Podospora aff. communis PSN243]|uniref:Uncharacterized protein n=1 Tax=Podospora aff. communis PSN243 TaxID=3040156 RepID=A0AAV9GKB2_9PEZI|nr:hypothetical protein QBC34DRAFT_465704 [Podospora aff. communis PSN243]